MTEALPTGQTPPTTALSTKSKAELIRDYLAANNKAIASALPRIGLTAEALAKTALTQIYANPKLLECSKGSIIKAVIEGAQLGLPFQLGRAYIVPRWNKHKRTTEACFQPGYLGLLDLVRRSGEVKSIRAEAVYEGDDFHYEFSLREDDIKHTPKVEPQAAKLTHVYCIIRFKDGGEQFGVMTRAEVEAIRKKSPSGESGPWADPSTYPAMAIKTVIRKVAKLAPMSVELQRAVTLDEAAELGAPTFEVPDDVDEADTDERTIEREVPKGTAATLKETLKASKKTAAKRAEVLEAEVVTHSGPPAETIAELKMLLLSRNGGSQGRAEVMLSELTEGRLTQWSDLEGTKLTSDVIATLDAALSPAEAGAE